MESRETEDRIDNLVICSTLNQITNYLIIKKYKPKTIYNITFAGETNINITPKDWDERLFDTIDADSNHLIGYKPKRIDVKLTNDDISCNNDLKSKLKREIIKTENKVIYWNITGGQRIISIAISELLKEDKRVKDKYLYVEGNSEKLYINDYLGNIDGDVETYNDFELNFETALKLVGIKTNELNCKLILKGSKCSTDVKNTKNYKIYQYIYELFCEDQMTYKLEKSEIEDSVSKKKYTIRKEFSEGTFRNLLLKSNLISAKEERNLFVKEVFKTVIEKKQEKNEFTNLNEKEIDELKELNLSYPAGYILEKIAAYKIFELTESNEHVVDLRTSLKTQFDSDTEKYGTVDELDIVLLTDTGKIINFECKSGGMSGDNAKSTNYTTYRLAGVFGMPVLVSPLYSRETIDDSDKKYEFLKNQFSALRSAERAELNVIHINDIKNGLRKLGIETNE